MKMAGEPCGVSTKKSIASMLDIILINDYKCFYSPYSYGKTSLFAYLIKHGWKVDIIQPRDIGKLGRHPARFFGVGSWSLDFWRVVKAAFFLKQRYPQIPIICGGGHVTACSSELEKHADIFDYWVLGEGEVALNEILQGKHRRHIFIQRPVEATDITLPSLAHNKIMIGQHTSLSSRGCPHDCTFCNAHGVFGHRTRHMPVPQYIQYIKTLLKQGMTTIFFIDSSLLNDPNWTTDFCNAIIVDQLRFNWTANVCAEQLTETRIALMRKAGCVLITIGVESGFPPLLKALNKIPRLSETRRSVELCRRYGIYTQAHLMYGVLDESRASMAATREFYTLIKPDFLSLARYEPMPGTAMFDEAQRRGLLSAYDWSQGQPPQLIHTGQMTIDEMHQEYDKLWSKEYLRRAYISSKQRRQIFWVVMRENALLKLLHLRMLVFILSWGIWPASLREKLLDYRLKLILRKQCRAYRMVTRIATH